MGLLPICSRLHLHFVPHTNPVWTVSSTPHVYLRGEKNSLQKMGWFPRCRSYTVQHIAHLLSSITLISAYHAEVLAFWCLVNWTLRGEEWPCVTGAVCWLKFQMKAAFSAQWLCTLEQQPAFLTQKHQAMEKAACALLHVAALNKSNR